MKICIPIKYQPRGGMYSFIQNFTNYLESHGIPYTDEVGEPYDILFVNSFMVAYNLIKRVKQRLRQVKVVQRVDGSARDYGRLDDADNRQARVNLLADLTVFQSRYSRYSTRDKFKVISQEGPIIYNAVDTILFSPEGEKLTFPYRVKVCHVTFSTNPKKGLSAVYEAAEANPDIDFILCGHHEESRPLANIHFLGYLGREELSRVMRSCDLLLFFSENESCPNVVLEGMASGLPVLYKDSGGTPELVGNCGLTVEVNNLREQLEKVLSQRRELSEAARARAVEYFSPDVIFPQYLKAIEQAERRPLPAAADFIRALHQGYQVIPYSPRQLVYSIKQKIRGARELIKRTVSITRIYTTCLIK
jgi:glycosyltransferase involved in cell wall biosynthesis